MWNTVRLFFASLIMITSPALVLANDYGKLGEPGDDTTYIMTMVADSGHLLDLEEGWVLKLSGLHEHTLLISDRPERKSAHKSTQKVLDHWQRVVGEISPNAILQYTDKTGGYNDPMAVELVSLLHVEGKDATFKVKPLQGDELTAVTFSHVLMMVE